MEFSNIIGVILTVLVGIVGWIANLGLQEIRTIKEDNKRMNDLVIRHDEGINQVRKQQHAIVELLNDQARRISDLEHNQASCRNNTNKQ